VPLAPANRGASSLAGSPDLSAAAPTGEADVQTGLPSSRLASRSLNAENEVMQTRSQEAVLRISSASGLAASPALTSMLNRTSGQAPRRSSSSGIGSVPPIRAAATSRAGREAIAPARSVTRSRVLS
jgi:hypothetical protein